MADLKALEAEGYARATLRRAYHNDVDALASEYTARIRRGDFDRSIYWFDEALFAVVLRHPRVQSEQLALETVLCSENRPAIETDCIEAWPPDAAGPWATFEIGIDPDIGEPWTITLPPWGAIACYAFFRDVFERLRELLGDTPEGYVETRYGW
jgi:hypothetical protein